MAGSKKARKDNRGRILRIGESYVAEQSIYKYRFTDFLGQRHTIYDKDLLSLRKKEEALQFFVDNYEKYREIYLPTMLKYYQDLRSCLGYDEEYEVDGYPYITTIDQLLETIEFTGMIVHDDKKDGKHAIGLFFDATWEEEHGAGVLMAGFDVLDTGNQDHAYYTYALH